MGLLDAPGLPRTQALDFATLRSLENNGLNTARRQAGQAVIDYSDATQLTEDWTSLGTASGVQVSGNRLYGVNGANPSAAIRSFQVGSSRFHAVTTINYLGSGGGPVLFGFNCDAAGAAPAASSPNAIMIGINGGGVLSAYVGASLTGISSGTGGATAVSGHTYEVTITGDDTYISLFIRDRTDTTVVPYGIVVSRATLTSLGKTINNLMGYVYDTRGLTGNSLSGFAAVLSQQPVRTKTIASVPVEGVGHRDLYAFSTGSSAGDKWRIQVPANYDPRRPAPVLLYMHQSKLGTNSLDRPFNDARDLGITQGLAADGYIVAAAYDVLPDRWGNQASLDNYLDLYAYVRSHYATSHLVLWGVSMGGLPMLSLLAQRKTPKVAAAFTVGGVCDLDTLYAQSTYTADILTAYGAAGDGSDYATKTAGFNPMKLSGWQFRGTPMRFYTSTTDTIVPAATNQVLMAAKVAPYAPEATVVYGTGGHLDASQYQIANVRSFLAPYAA